MRAVLEPAAGVTEAVEHAERDQQSGKESDIEHAGSIGWVPDNSGGRRKANRSKSSLGRKDRVKIPLQTY
jgi:hypothetical protein